MSKTITTKQIPSSHCWVTCVVFIKVVCAACRHEVCPMARRIGRPLPHQQWQTQASHYKSPRRNRARCWNLIDCWSFSHLSARGVTAAAQRVTMLGAQRASLFRCILHYACARMNLSSRWCIMRARALWEEIICSQENVYHCWRPAGKCETSWK